MNEKFTKWSKVLCWVLIVMGILMNAFGFCVVAEIVPRTDKLDFDYNGVIVGVLSLLVTTLLGWNVYTLIDLKNHAEQNHRIKNELQELKKNNNENLAQVEETLALLFLNEDIYHEESVRTYESLRHWISYITINAEMENYSTCNNTITRIKDFYDKSTIHFFDKCELKSLIEKIPNKRNIKSIKMLSTTVNELNENTELMNELHHAAFEVLSLYPGITCDKWVKILMEQYHTDVTDALGTDDYLSRSRLKQMWDEPFTDNSKITHTFAEWAALL